MELDIAEDVLVHSRLRNFFWIQTKLRNRIAYRNSLRVVAAQRFLIQATYERAAADKRRAEANTLFF
jgi:hypothetical protein